MSIRYVLYLRPRYLRVRISRMGICDRAIYGCASGIWLSDLRFAPSGDDGGIADAFALGVSYCDGRCSGGTSPSLSAGALSMHMRLAVLLRDSDGRPSDGFQDLRLRASRVSEFHERWGSTGLRVHVHDGHVYLSRLIRRRWSNSTPLEYVRYSRAMFWCSRYRCPLFSLGLAWCPVSFFWPLLVLGRVFRFRFAVSCLAPSGDIEFPASIGSRNLHLMLIGGGICHGILGFYG